MTYRHRRATAASENAPVQIVMRSAVAHFPTPNGVACGARHARAVAYGSDLDGVTCRACRRTYAFMGADYGVDPLSLRRWRRLKTHFRTKTGGIACRRAYRESYLQDPTDEVIQVTCRRCAATPEFDAAAKRAVRRAVAWRERENFPIYHVGALGERERAACGAKDGFVEIDEPAIVTCADCRRTPDYKRADADTARKRAGEPLAHLYFGTMYMPACLAREERAAERAGYAHLVTCADCRRTPIFELAVERLITKWLTWP